MKAPVRPPPDEKEAYVRALFDRIAGHYDAINQVMSLGQWRRWHRVFIGLTGLQPGMRTLDVACGTGDLTLLCAARVHPGGQVVGVDISEGMLSVARKRVEASPYREGVAVRPGNAMDLPFPDQSFDCVTMGWAMRNVASIPRTIAEAYRVLRPGGRYVSLEAAVPPGRLGRAVLFTWWRTLLPLIDRLVVGAGRGSPVRPYTYLSRSLAGYPDPAALADHFRAAGFAAVDYRPLMLGSVCIHHGTRPAS